MFQVEALLDQPWTNKIGSTASELAGATAAPVTQIARADINAERRLFNMFPSLGEAGRLPGPQLDLAGDLTQEKLINV
ncbi:MAG TPA: hypothetical protein VEQ41_06410 [Solirubrobacterales bacterium]|nr:hypothetical protein [Solirubrobacterales bacterium]